MKSVTSAVHDHCFSSLHDTMQLMQLLLEREKGKDAVNYFHAYLRKFGLTLVQTVLDDDKSVL